MINFINISNFEKKIIITIIIGIIMIIYLYFQNTLLKTSYYEIKDKKIPREFNNYKIIQISDFHNEKSKYLTNQIINKIKDENPNIIVITGDLVDSNRPNIDTSINLIKEINKVIKIDTKIYYVIGNHEKQINEYKRLIKELKDNNVIVLNNDSIELKKGKSSINIIGIDDPYRPNDKNNKEQIEKEINSINYNKNNYSILLSHRPEAFDKYVELNINLVFSGHAHGGQIRIPFIGGIFAPHQGLFPKYDSGVFNKNNTNMVVSRGLGNSTFPLRVNNRPELVVVTLKVGE